MQLSPNRRRYYKAMSENMERWRHLDGSAAQLDTEFVKIQFQHGNPAEVGVNGVSVEDVIEILVQKLLDFQGRDLACLENAVALWHLDAAQESLLARRKKRADQGVLGTAEAHVTEEVQMRRAPVEEFPTFSS